MKLDRYFDPSRGILAKSLPGWEARPEQALMADVVARCLESGGACAVEAATGTGKTFAYLVPALLAQRRVLVATGTRNLEDQVFHKDLPLLRSVEGLGAEAVLMKGLSNYICLRRLERLRRRTGGLSLDIDPHLGRLLSWASTTRTGDVAELEGVPEGYAAQLEVVSGASTRIGTSCPFHADCFITSLRRRAEKARLLIVNHHLFFADLVLRDVADGVLPDYDAIILDEAHRLEDVATESFGQTASLALVASAVHEGLRVVRGEYSDREGTRPGAGGRDAVLEAVHRSAEAFFEALGRRLAPLALERRMQTGAGTRTWPDDDQPILRAAIEEPFLDERTIPMYHELDSLLERAAATVAASPAAGDIAALAGRRFLEARDGIAAVLDRELPGCVFWAAVHQKDPVRTAIGASPVDLAPIFRERVFERIGSVVLTSATLTPDGSMRHLARSIGYPIEDAESLVLESPFDVGSRAILYVPDSVPEPGDPACAEGIAGEIDRLVGLTGGGALVLFCSFRMMRSCFKLCHETLRDYNVLLQGDAPKHTLLSQLKQGGDSVLFATASFREGVDVPGPALRLVIVDKIPFSVPDEPIAMARGRRIREAGGDPFNDLHLPAAALALKQGLGRLLRTRSDSGILAVLDPRIWSRRYGKRILRALPRCPVTRDFGEIEEFWQRVGGWSKVGGLDG